MILEAYSLKSLHCSRSPGLARTSAAVEVHLLNEMKAANNCLLKLASIGDAHGKITLDVEKQDPM